ncbi:MAG: hypothetical protein AB7I04_18390 [Pseudomonadales bacterium]
MKLSLGVVLLALAFGTLTGPLETLATIPDGALVDATFWRQVGEESVRAFATTGSALIAVVAAGLGLPMIRRNQVEEIPKASSSAPAKPPAE